MADENTSRSYRSIDPYRRSAQPSGSGSQGPATDPLAELARLIGQPDPFADYGGSQARSDAREAPRPQPAQRPQPKAPAPPADWRRAAAAMPAYESFPEEDVRQQRRRSEPHFAPTDTGYERHDPYQMASEEPPDRHYRREPQFAEAAEFHDRDSERMFAAAAGRETHLQEPHFEHGAVLGPEDEESYDDPQRPRRRGGLLTAVTLIGCAMVGTAGAYGYRTYYVAPNTGKTPPIITAEATPSKVVSAGDIQTGKIMDRVRDPFQTERVVSREEQPAEIRPPQSVFPPPPSVTSSVPSGPPPAGARSPGEPRAIRTIPIRPDGTDARTSGNAQPSGPAASRGTQAPKAAPTARNSGPLSLAPETGEPAQPAPAPRDRVAAVPPPAPQAPPLQPPAPRAAPAPATGAGGYLVQVSSQRSEAEAQASWRALQAKYPDQLGSHSATIKRVDLGDKGVYYRAMVGPFASSGEADQLCSELKAAGGQCLRQRN